MKYISHDLKKFFLGVNIKMLKLALKELRSITKRGKTNDCKSMFKNQLINLNTTRPEFKIEYIVNYLREN